MFLSSYIYIYTYIYIYYAIAGHVDKAEVVKPDEQHRFAFEFFDKVMGKTFTASEVGLRQDVALNLWREPLWFPYVSPRAPNPQDTSENFHCCRTQKLVFDI